MNDPAIAPAIDPALASVADLDEAHGAAYVHAFAGQLARAATVLDGAAALAPTARADLVGQLARRWLGCTLTAFVADGGAPDDAAGWYAFLARYPVCRRLLAESEHAWRADCARLLAALAADAPAAQLVRVSHHAGLFASRRSAYLLALADGRAPIYRADPLPAAAWFLDLCRALAPHLPLPLHVRALRVADDHTWDEPVAAAPCPADAHARYFVRCGMLLRLAEATRALDLHVRNLRMAGEHPVILDLEGVLAHREAPSLTAAGLLHPTLGGLHPGGEVALPTRQPRLRDGAFELVAPQKRVDPTIPAPLAAHTDELAAGYTALDAALAALDPAPWLARAAALRSRVFGRPGMAVRSLLFDSAAPALLRDEAARDAFLAEHAAPLERGFFRSLRAPRFVGAPPVPALARHPPDVLAARLAEIHELCAAAATTGSAS